jgi:hypothetical protein
MDRRQNLSEKSVKSNGFETPSSNSINGRTNDINICAVDYL